MIASVDTLIRREVDLSNVKLWQCDESHHLQAVDSENGHKGNKWGKAIALLDAAGALGIGWTATPVRLDRKSLKRGRGGLFDTMVVGPSARELIRRGHLADYKLYGLPQRMDMSHVRMRGDDFDARDLRKEAKASAITGDIVLHYQRLASGLTGITFAVDVELAGEHAQAFRAAGIPAAVLSSETPSTERTAINRGIRNGELLQIVNVDILGEGYDLPAAHCVSMARPTMSLVLYIQQSMRPMRPDGPGKTAILLDHVGNVQRHGLPDGHREWALDTPERRTTTQTSVGLQICGNPECMLAYEGFEPRCPFCEWERPKGSGGGRERPEMLDGDLVAYDEETLRALRGEAERIASAPILPAGLSGVARAGAEKKRRARADAQAQLQAAIDRWGGEMVARGDSVRAAYRRFKATFGVDVLTAQLGTARELEAMRDRVGMSILEMNKPEWMTK
jgi:superfamily II DNA or RNA helicase